MTTLEPIEDASQGGRVHPRKARQFGRADGTLPNDHIEALQVEAFERQPRTYLLVENRELTAQIPQCLLHERRRRSLASSLTTITGTDVALPDPESVTHLQVRRFAACPICNVHLRTFVTRHHEIEAAHVRELVVFHSDASAMRPHQGNLPFSAIADPQRRLYDEFGVELSWRSILNPAAWTAPLKPMAWRVAMRELRDPDAKPFRVRGGPITGMPAEFLIAPGGTVRAAKYGSHANDQWSVDDLLHAVETTADGAELSSRGRTGAGPPTMNSTRTAT